MEKYAGKVVETLWKTEQLILEFDVLSTSGIFDNAQRVSGTNVWYWK